MTDHKYDNCAYNLLKKHILSNMAKYLCMCEKSVPCGGKLKQWRRA